MASFPEINWITEGDNFEDYRPAIGPDGGTVIFERTYFDIYPPANVGRCFLAAYRRLNPRNPMSIAFAGQPTLPRRRRSTTGPEHHPRASFS